MMNAMQHTMRKFLRDRGGNAAVELALCVPFLAMLLLGGVELTRYILITQKLEKVAVTLSDVATQSESISSTELNTIVQAAGQVMQPYSFSANGYVIISSVSKTGTNPPRVNWQYTSSGSSGSWTNASRVGTPGANATMPSGFIMNDLENVIVSEVFYNFQPMFGTNIIPGGNVTVYKTGFFRPRLGSLTTLSMLELPTPWNWLGGQPWAYKGGIL
jgi:Flp pilus assembly protein TadG